MPSPQLQARVEQAVRLVKSNQKIVHHALNEVFGGKMSQQIDDLHGRALTLQALDMPEKALTPAARAATQQPHDLELQLLAARLASQLENVPVAERFYKLALKMAVDNDADLLAEYALFLAHHRGPKTAEKAALAVLEIDVSNADAWAARGLAQHRLHQYEEGRQSVLWALELEPENVAALSVVGEWLVQAKSIEQAERVAGALVELPGGEAAGRRIAKKANQVRAMKLLYERQEVQNAVAAQFALEAGVDAAADRNRRMALGVAKAFLENLVF